MPHHHSDFLWLAMNKPADTITTRRDPEGRKTVYEFLPLDIPRVEAVGRLDRASTGLLLFTNDSKLSQHLLDPESEVPRIYQVVTDVPLPEPAIQRLQQGICLADGTEYRGAQITPLPGPALGRSYRFILREGKNREIRKLVESVGRRVRGLHRLAYGAIQLGDLRCGKVRVLETWEVDQLRKIIRHANG